jgi:hypothetical protein
LPPVSLTISGSLSGSKPEIWLDTGFSR